ncbi:uncharacterized protein HRG_07457 [Hirsutella rhossiliensis]|uniref:Uncharacterized protein n=1 Tax=Hirsutella rhossiliensis TaxID=111463 RepID=A0A9P8MVX1_9HYPO|nr:uncharacterized protein HRG_07457 [Hirsutella rhossiliensis]KAH0961379.1 hypothetical protein HRG_07457 [Hirsutella rhossiliensis]
MLTLSSLETISSAPLTCTLAYNAPIQGCSLGDFSKKTCSRSCLQSIDGIQATIQTICGSTKASQNSLLSRAQKGGLVDALCGTGSGADTTVIVTPSRSISVTPTSTTSTSSSSPRVSRASTPTLSPSSTTSSTSIVAQPSNNPGSLEPTSTPSRPQPPADRETSTSSVAQGPTFSPQSGGGSPFDLATSTSPATKKQLSAMSILVGWALAALLVQ